MEFVANLALVAVAVFTGTAQGSQPLISKSYGKGEKIQVRAFYLVCGCHSICFGSFYDPGGIHEYFELCGGL